MFRWKIIVLSCVLLLLNTIAFSDTVIKSFSGTGMQTTRPFEVNGPWECQWKAKGMLFQIELYTADGSLVNIIANQLGSGNGSSYQPKGGKYYIEINSIGDWKVNIVQISKTFTSENQSNDKSILDTDNIAKFYKKLCDRGSAFGCRKCGHLTLECFSNDMFNNSSNNENYDIETPLKFYAKACSMGDAISCKMANVFSALAVYGYGIKKDYHKVTQSLKKACNNKNALGCLMLGVLYRGGEVIKKDNYKSFYFSKKACEDGNALGCMVVSASYLDGEGVKKNQYKAIEFMNKACQEGSSESCNMLGKLYSNSKGAIVKRNPSKAAEFFKKAHYNILECNFFKNVEFRNNNKNIINFFKKACDTGDALSCDVLGADFNDKKSIQRNPSKAAEFFKKACDGNSVLGCRRLGIMYSNGDGVPLNKSKAYYYFIKASKQGDIKSQNYLSKLCSKNPEICKNVRQYNKKKYNEIYSDIDFIAKRHFKKGERYFALKQYRRAIIAFDYVVTTFPTSKYYTEAMLQEGISFLKIGDRFDGKFLLGKVVREFPGSKYAKMAKSYLNSY